MNKKNRTNTIALIVCMAVLALIIVASILVYAKSSNKEENNNQNITSHGYRNAINEERKKQEEAIQNETNNFNLEELPKYSKIEDSNYITYTYKNGTSFMYPKSWENYGTDDSPVFISTDLKLAAVNISTDKITSSSSSVTMTFDGYMALTKVSLLQNLILTSNFEEKIINLNGRKAYMLEFVSENEQSGITFETNVIQVAFEDKGEVNILSLSVLKDYYNDYEEVFNKIISSFTK